MKHLERLLVLAICWVWGAGAAHACRCDPISPEAGFDRAQYVFAGKVVQAENHAWLIEVERVWKGHERRAVFKEAESFPPLNYEKKGGTIDLAFWRAPERLFDDPDELVTWAQAALAAARRVAAKRERTAPGRKSKPQPA